MDTSSSQLADEPPAPAPPSPPVAVEEEKPGFHGMYFGILITFVIFWAIYLFLYFFEYETAGDYFFYMSSYVVRSSLICLA